MRAVINAIKLNKVQSPSEAVLTASMTTAVDAVAGAEILWDFADEKAILLVENINGSPKTCTIKAGNGIQGTTDFTFSVEANSFKLVQLESGRFLNTAGAKAEDVGKVIVMGEDVNIKLAVFVGA